MMEEKYCMACGTKLEMKYLEHEGMIPYCPHCQQYRFPVFSTAVSMVVLNEEKDHVLLIQQYGKPGNILVAGYVNKGEDAEDAVSREVKEEMNLDVTEMHFNRSHYFAPSNTLMLNYTVIVKGTPQPDYEIDHWQWYTIEEAKHSMRKGSLAEQFLLGYFSKTYSFERQ